MQSQRDLQGRAGDTLCQGVRGSLWDTRGPGLFPCLPGQLLWTQDISVCVCVCKGDALCRCVCVNMCASECVNVCAGEHESVCRCVCVSVYRCVYLFSGVYEPVYR